MRWILGGGLVLVALAACVDDETHYRDDNDHCDDAIEDARGTGGENAILLCVCGLYAYCPDFTGGFGGGGAGGAP